MFLADTSSWIWSRKHAYPHVRRAFDDQLMAGEIVSCDPVRLELLAGVHSSQYAARRLDLDALDTCPVTEQEWTRAFEVHGELAQRGTDLHKGVRPMDLVIAAAAESAGVALLHYDAHFELIERVTGQPMRWLAPKGTLR
ncbi:MAG TPA: PIN domain-containing protein [Gaiellaceae bacterium]|jgi:predicted nucleic acid-binding protein